MSDDKKQVVKTGLHDTGHNDVVNLIATSIKGLDSDKLQELRLKAAEKALELEIKSRDMNLDYVDGKKKTEDHIETFDLLDKKGKMTRHSVVTEIKSSNSSMKIESKSGATCFVATATYGDPQHPDVVLLRKFRDEKLCPTLMGRTFITIYWSVGPLLAKLVSQNEPLKQFFKCVIAKIAELIRLHEGW